MKGPTLIVKKDILKKINDSIKSFAGKATLVGIPQENTARDKTDGQQINNATLLFIHNFGSPANNIPARPVMDIGIEKVQDQIALEFGKAAVAALSKGNAAIDLYYERIGVIASSSVKQVINNQEGIEAPSEATLKARKAAGFKGTKALIKTAQMRNAITYVVKG